MKPIATYLLLSLLLSTISSISLGQQISSLSVIPEAPISSDDIVSVIAEAWHPSSGCPIVNTQITQIQDTIYVEVIHDLGLALAICDSKDTTDLGSFNQGTYTVTYLMTSGVFGDISATDTAYTQFTVDGVNSVFDLDDKADLSVYPNPSKDFFEISTEQRGSANLFDSQGRVVRTIDLLENPTRVSSNELPPGLYILRLNNTRSAKGIRVVIE